jgi:tetratricopeptide (TPR) repeat protein
MEPRRPEEREGENETWRLRGKLALVALVVALAVTMVLFPQAASAWFLNLANARIARAVSLPQNAPDRATALAGADVHLNQARQYSNVERLPLAQARLLLARGDARRAAEAFQDSAPRQPDSITEYVWAEAAWQSQQPRTAFAHWRAAGAIEFFRQEAHRAVDAHRWNDAENLARIAVGIDPALGDAHFVLGDALSRQSPDNPEALSELDRALELTRDNEIRSSILSRKAEIFASQGRLPDALDLFNQARRIAPTDARPRTGYALTLLQLQSASRDQGIALLKQVVDDSPWYTAAYIALANLAESDGDLKGAEAWLQKGLAKNLNDARLLFPLGELYVRQHRIDEARKTLTLALSYETRADALQAIARSLAELNRQ